MRTCRQQFQECWEKGVWDVLIQPWRTSWWWRCGNSCGGAELQKWMQGRETVFDNSCGRGIEYVMLDVSAGTLAADGVDRLAPLKWQEVQRAFKPRRASGALGWGDGLRAAELWGHHYEAHRDQQSGALYTSMGGQLRPISVAESLLKYSPKPPKCHVCGKVFAIFSHSKFSFAFRGGGWLPFPNPTKSCYPKLHLLQGCVQNRKTICL